MKQVLHMMIKRNIYYQAGVIYFEQKKMDSLLLPIFLLFFII